MISFCCWRVSDRIVRSWILTGRIQSRRANSHQTLSTLSYISRLSRLSTKSAGSHWLKLSSSYQLPTTQTAARSSPELHGECLIKAPLPSPEIPLNDPQSPLHILTDSDSCFQNLQPPLYLSPSLRMVAAINASVNRTCKLAS